MSKIQINPQEIEKHISTKKEFNKLFPQIFYNIGAKVEQQLKTKFDGMYTVVGEEHLQVMAERFPELGVNIPLDWVAFGFKGYDLYDVHVGVIFLMEELPAQFHVGVHFLDYIFEHVKEKCNQIDWTKEIGYQTEYIYEPPVRENRFSTTPQNIDFSQIEKLEDQIVDYVVRFYNLAAPLADYALTKKK